MPAETTMSPRFAQTPWEAQQAVGHFAAYVGSSSISKVIPDPGDAGVIDVTKSGTITLDVGALAETGSLPDPTFVGQLLSITCGVKGAGSRAITAVSAINVASNTVMTFTAVRQSIVLLAIEVPGGFAWTIVGNNAVGLS